jgi:hypothetical protein
MVFPNCSNGRRLEKRFYRSGSSLESTDFNPFYSISTRKLSFKTIFLSRSKAIKEECIRFKRFFYPAVRNFFTSFISEPNVLIFNQLRLCSPDLWFTAPRLRCLWRAPLLPSALTSSPFATCQSSYLFQNLFWNSGSQDFSTFFG